MTSARQQQPAPADVDLSIVIPVFNEESGLAALADRLEGLRRSLPELTIEVILVDDHSTDRSVEVLSGICAAHEGFRIIRLAANSGSHIAIIAGLDHARGRCMVFLAADLQDPPELVPQMLEQWRAGFQVVWAVREGWEKRSLRDRVFAGVFYAVFNRLAQIRMAPQGSDFVLMDRAVVQALRSSVSAAPFLMGEIARLGFRATELYYRKDTRRFGTSKWTLGKKLRVFADAFVAMSYAPLRLMSYAGLLCMLLGGAGVASLACLWWLGSRPVAGWLWLAALIALFSGFQMTMLGVMGEYLWRTLETARRRPLYHLEPVPSGGADANACAP